MSTSKFTDGLGPVIASLFVLLLLASVMMHSTQGTGDDVTSLLFDSPRQMCISGDYQCSNNVLQFCQEGAWSNQEICSDGCKNNACIAGTACTPETYQCMNDYVQTCYQGGWTNHEKCPSGCLNGQCVQDNQCRPGEYRCLTEDYLQICNYGVWFNKARCRSGCKDGACVEFIKERSCTDTDDRDFLQRGVASGNNIHDDYFAETDKCISEQDLIEYSCNNGYLIKDSYLCPGVCNNGKCEDAEEEMLPEEIIGVDYDDEIIINQTDELDEPEPIIDMPETDGLLTRFWNWVKGIFSVQ